jgi:hypothetical protein
VVWGQAILVGPRHHEFEMDDMAMGMSLQLQNTCKVRTHHGSIQALWAMGDA